MLELAMADGGGANDQRAVGDGIGDCLEFFRGGQQGGRADGRARLAKRGVEGVDESETLKAEVRHGARRRANVERIARGHQDDTEAVGFHGAGHTQ